MITPGRSYLWFVLILAVALPGFGATPKLPNVVSLLNVGKARPEILDRLKRQLLQINASVMADGAD